MKRFLSNESIVGAFRRLKREGIKTSSFNIIGVPGETLHTVLDTVRINAQARPNRFINAYFNAFQGTELYNYCQEHNIPIREVGSSLFARPVVLIPTLPETQMVFAFKYFPLFVHVYSLLYRLPFGLVKPIDRLLETAITSRIFPHAFCNAINVFDYTTLTGFLQKHPWLYNLAHKVRRKLGIL
jgi:radical SAM superfamily enzyme YgiQ (UPF0313 family)